jgi:hypothetical protein
MALSKAERARVRAALKSGDPAKLEGAAEIHQFAHHYNWDDGVAALDALTAHPSCDLGTALLLYWSSEPGYAHDRYGSLDEAVAAKDVNLAAIRFAEGLAQKIESGGFARGTIRFVPPSVMGKKRPFLPSVTRPSEGMEQPPQALDDISVEALDEEDRAALAKKIAAGYAALKKQGIVLNANAEPTVIVGALAELAKKLPDLQPPLPKAALGNLGFTFAEQIHRAFGVQWRVRCANKARDPMLFSDDRAVSFNPARVMGALADRSIHSHFSLEGLFHAFGKVVRNGEGFTSVLSPEESKHLYRDANGPGTWPVWGVYWKLPPWP